jgi:hypothetical protein
MKKLILTAFMALFVVSQANAAFIQGVTGEDMAGINVIVTYDNGTTDAAMFMAGNAGEGLAISLDGWSLMLSGDSFGEYDAVADEYYGVWAFINNTAMAITSLYIDLSPMGFVFDTEYGDASLNGSGAGRELVSNNPTLEVIYTSQYMDELYTGVTLSSAMGVLVGDGSSLLFMTDTDKVVDTPAPASLAFIVLALAGLGARARKLAA